MDSIRLSAFNTSTGTIGSVPLSYVGELVSRATLQESSPKVPVVVDDETKLGSVTLTVQSESIVNDIPVSSLDNSNSGHLCVYNNATYTDTLNTLLGGEVPLAPSPDTLISVDDSSTIGNNWDLAIATSVAFSPSPPSVQPTVTLVNNTSISMTMSVMLQDATVNNGVPAFRVYRAAPGDVVAVFGSNGDGLYLAASRIQLSYFAYGVDTESNLFMAMVTNAYISGGI